MTITSPETMKVSREILERFCSWADDRIIDAKFDHGETGSEFTKARKGAEITCLQFAKKNLIKIIKEIVEVDK